MSSKMKGKKLPAFAGPLMAVILLSVILTIVSAQFLTMDNWMNILRQTAINALVSCGMLMVLLTGGIDLSVGPVVALSSCAMGILVQRGVTNPLLLIVVALFVGFLCGGFNGLLFTKLKLPHPFVSTMGARQIYRGLALFITGAAPIAGFPAAVMFLGYQNIGSIKFPVCFLAVIVIFAIMGIFLNRTALGRKIYSVGGNKEAARLSGINVSSTLNFAYIMSGIMSAIAGIVLVGRVGTALPLAGETYDMDAIAACVIGGASFSGGKGTVSGTLMGALLIAVIRNGLNLLGAQTDIQYIVIGAVIIAAVFVDVVRGNAEARSRRLAMAKKAAE
ncbi:ABC transporter permease [Intestinibacillus massiliensis]|uniref:ABC transporter permease n=1 Tax=Intestinibacillus massiliensis TaxID=1871029 RepID=UPI001D085680|nr:ABC transporter permease [Intestinibacillus massiliensis]MCB6365780.1 ABC transporter permease [Intestinibacillus massiliensis]